MEIIGKRNERSTLFIAIIALLVIGSALSFSTWRMLRQEKKASLEHLALTARSVLQAVDGSLRRSSGQMGRFNREIAGQERLAPGTIEFFRELQEEEDLLFVAFIDDTGTFLTPLRTQPKGPLSLPPDARQTLASEGRWHGSAQFNGQSVYLAAQRMTPLRMRHDGGRNFSGGRMGGSRDHHTLNEAISPAQGELPILAVGLDMSKHTAVYNTFRRTAFWQMAYILAATIFLWILAIRFISRRELAGKAVYLERLQTRLLDTMPDGLLIADAEGTIRAVNPAAQNIFTATEPHLAGTSLQKLFQQLLLPWPPPTSRQDNAWMHATHNDAFLELLCLPFEAEQNTQGLMVIIRDRTRIRTLERSLGEAEKLAAVGTLAAGVAHEIRNPLSSLRGFAQYFAKKLAGKMPEAEYANTMVREADRLNRVITDLLYLARHRTLESTHVNLAELVGELTTLLRFDLEEHHAQLLQELKSPTVLADRDAIKQALLNLLLNALDTVTLRTEADTPFTIHLRSWREANGVWVAVEDNGPGMTKEQRAQAFEPFFTTKSKGTGLGLALVHKTMREHDGKADIDSSPGKGCAVRLFFPDTQGTL